MRDETAIRIWFEENDNTNLFRGFLDENKAVRSKEKRETLI